MTAQRRWALTLAFTAAIVEGIDLQAMGVAAPGMAAEFRLAPSMLGYLGSASSLGLFFGALLGGSLSDRVGRRSVLFWSVLSFGVFTLLTPFAHSSTTLLLVRLLAGLGLGGGLPMIIAVAAEAVPPQRRAGTVTTMYCSTPLGGIVASLIALLAGSDWRVIFYLGGLAPILIAPLIAWKLHDAPAHDAEAEASAVVAAGSPQGVARGGGLRALFGAHRGLVTVLLWIALFGAVLQLYLLLVWLPSLMVGKGFSRADASIVQMLYNLGGACGAVLLGYLSGRVRRRTLLAAIALVGAASIVALGAIGAVFSAAIAAAFVAGLYSMGTVFVLYGVAAVAYPRAVRGTGVGWAVGWGRLGSIAGPMLAGELLTAGRTPAQVLLGLLPIVIVSAVVGIWLAFRVSDTADGVGVVH